MQGTCKFRASGVSARLVLLLRLSESGSRFYAHPPPLEGGLIRGVGMTFGCLRKNERLFV